MSTSLVDGILSSPLHGKAGHSNDTQVAVVGGGMAGLAAASSLSEAGFDVVLFEAADYLGGRVKQVQPFKGFAPIDLGGEFIHGSDSIINRTAKENGWVVQPIPTSCTLNFTQFIIMSLQGKAGHSHDTQVAVVGGGMAGLAAASSLSEAGFDVVLFEAADYLGGRVKQVQPFKGFAPIDLGGEFIHGSDSIINRTAKENGWVVQPCHQCEGIENGYMFYYKGKLHSLLSSHPDIQKAWKAWDDIIFFWEKRSKTEPPQSVENFCETDQAANVYNSDCKSAEDHRTQPDSASIKNSGVTKLEETQEMDYRQSTVNSDLKAPLRDMSIQEWLERKECDEDVIAVFEAMYCQTIAATPKRMGLFESAREENAWQYGSGNYRLAESYALLVEHLLNKCAKVDKRLDWHVREIDWTGVAGQNREQDKLNPAGKVCLKNQRGETFTSKYVVITVPLTILKDGDISFIPALPASKKKAIDVIEMRGALKIVCRFTSQFWPDDLKLIYNVRGFVSQIWMYSRDSTDNHEKCHLVAGFETAAPAEEKIHLSGEEVLEGFLKHLDEIFRTDLNPHPASDSYMDYVYYHWSKHPFIRGGYSSPTVHAHGLRDELAKPVEDRLFFAGEATSVTACATVHTAIETGLRAAREVCSISKRVYTK